MALTSRSKHVRAWSALVWLVAGGGLLAGCGSEEIPVIGIAHPTLVEVSPSAFLGEVPCLPAPGAMRSYVATIYDMHYADGGAPEGTDGGAGGADGLSLEFPLPSSTIDRGDGVATPVPCTQSVAFSHVVPTHEYRAEIAGYDRDDLLALAPGLSVLYDPSTGERVSPRWKTHCGDKLPVEAADSQTRAIDACEPLTDSAPPGDTVVEVRVDAALGDLECGTGTDNVDRFEVELASGEIHEAACGEAVRLTDLAPSNSALTMLLRAFEAGASAPKWGTQCIADIVPGVTTTATCLSLVSTGALEVSPEDALLALGLECSATSFVELELELTSGMQAPIRVNPTNCSRPLTFLGLAPGPATVRATARLPGGGMSGAASCTGTVVPGDKAPSTCVGEP